MSKPSGKNVTIKDCVFLGEKITEADRPVILAVANALNNQAIATQKLLDQLTSAPLLSIETNSNNEDV